MSLQVWLPLNGSLENKGLATLTSSGTATYKTSGKLGTNCFNLNSRITFTCSSLANKTIFSIAFWAKVNDDETLSTDWVDIIGFNDISTGGTTGQLRWETCYSSTNKARGISGHDNTVYAITQYSATSGTYPVTVKNIWEHRVFTVSATKCSEYINGELKATYGVNGGHLNGTFWIGQAGVVNGELQDVRIYDNVLSEKEIKEIAKGLVLHLPLNNNGLGNENILLNTNDLTLWNKESDVTINWDSNQQMYKMVVNKTNNTSRWGIYQNFTVAPNTTYTFSVEGLKGDHTTSMAVGTAESSIGWPANRYTFKTIKTKCVYTFTSGASDTVGRIYLNLQPTPDTGNKTAWFLHPKLELGDKATPYSPNPTDEDYPASGSGIPENLLAGTDLLTTPTSTGTNWEVPLRLYNGSVGLHTFTTENGIRTDTIALAAGTNSNLGIAFERLASEIRLDPNEYYTLSCEAKASNTNLKLSIGRSYYNDQSIWQWRGGENLKTFTTADTWQKITHTFKPDANTYAICYCFTVNPKDMTTDQTWSIRKCKLEKGSVATEWQPSPVDTTYKTLGYNNNITFDQSGYNYNAIKYGDIHTYTSDATKYNVSTYFSNKNQYIKISGLTTTGFGNSYSIAWWGKMDNLNYMQWGFMDGIRVNGMYTGRLWNTGDGSNNPLYIPGTTIQVTAPTANVWHHYVMTGNGTKCYVYVDG